MRKVFVFVFLLLVTVSSAYSAGTPAGTVITNKVKLTFDYGSEKGLESYAETSVIVDNKVNVVVTSLGTTSVTPGAKDVVLSFSLTNIGNSPQRYKLEAGPVYSPDNVEFTNIRIYLDKDSSGTLTAGDIKYIDAESFGDINPDTTLKILILADVPDTVENGKTSQYYLLATTVDAGTKTETKETTTVNTVGVDVVFADNAGIIDIARDGKHSALGTYLVKSAIVNIEKSLEIVSDPLGENKPNKNAIIRYILTVTVVGDATAEKVLVRDLVPDGTEYINKSIKLNGNQLTDEDDGDSGHFADNTVFVKLGDMTNKTPKQIISFEVKIK